MGRKGLLESRICTICGETYYVVATLKHNGKHPTGIRPRQAKTCSKKCSKILTYKKTKSL